MTLPDGANVEDYSEAEMNELLAKFATDKGSLTKNQKAAVARYNFKKGKNEPIVYRGQAPVAPPAPPAAAPAAAPAASAAGVTVADDILKLLPPEAQALAARDPATLSKDEKIALAKAKSQAVKAQQAAKDAAAAPAAEEGPKGPTPEELARQKALAFPYAMRLNDKFAADVTAWGMQVDKPYATVSAARVLDVVRYARDELGFAYLRNLTAVDYPPDRMDVVYNLFNMEKRQHLALRASVPRAAPEGADLPHLPSVVGVHLGADWLEREVFDLFGIRFDGHPYMRRLMMPDEWVGHPLRKDYDLKAEQFIGLRADGSDLVSFDSRDGW